MFWASLLRHRFTRILELRTESKFSAESLCRITNEKIMNPGNAPLNHDAPYLQVMGSNSALTRAVRNDTQSQHRITQCPSGQNVQCTARQI